MVRLTRGFAYGLTRIGRSTLAAGYTPQLVRIARRLTVRAGELRRVLINYACMTLRIYALLPGKRLVPAKARLFLDELEQRANRLADSAKSERTKSIDCLLNNAIMVAPAVAEHWHGAANGICRAD